MPATSENPISPLIAADRTARSPDLAARKQPSYIMTLANVALKRVTLTYPHVQTHMQRPSERTKRIPPSFQTLASEG